MNDIEKLKQVPLFSTMDDQEIAGIRAIMDENNFAPGQVIFREGDVGDNFHVIMEGDIQFLLQDASGGEVLLDEASAGGFFGELSMLTGEPRSARVRALGVVKTLSLDREEFTDFLMKHPHAGIDVMTVLGRRLLRSDKLIQQSVSKNINQIEDERMTFGQRLSDGFAAMMGSWKFIIWQSALLTVWVTWNAIAGIHNDSHPDNKWFLWDAYPFIFLNLALSFQAAYAAPIIMMSQNRSADKDRLAAEVDHDVNLKAEVEVGLIMRRLDDLERSIHHNHHEACRIFSNGAASPQSN